ncbi:MAG: hypothetical protein AAB316_22350 [Bacteroidota bacterium]
MERLKWSNGRPDFWTWWANSFKKLSSDTLKTGANIEAGFPNAQTLGEVFGLEFG